MKGTIRKSNDNKFEFNFMGMKLELSPIWLIKECMGEASQKIMDEMIICEHTRLVDDLVHFERKYESYDDEKKKLVDERELISEEVKAYADFSRHILVLSSDSEVILEDYEKKCSKEQKKAIEHAVSLYKYCDDYGYIKPTDISIEL